MGRNAKPVDVLIIEGKKHLTKEEIEARKENEIKFGDTELKCPDYVKKDPVAYKKWKEIKALYKEFDLVGSGDCGFIARYCMTFSEYQELLSSYQRIKEIHYDSAALEEAIDGTYYDEDAEKEKCLFSAKVKKQLRDMININAIISIEKAIDKKNALLSQMEDRLFLNPLAKIKNVPKQKKEEEPASKWGKFGGMSG